MQLQLDLIQHEAEGAVIEQRAKDGYINATALCKAAGKTFAHYKENASTNDFLQELSSDVGIPTLLLIQRVTDTYGVKSTWVHPQVAIHLGQWLSPKFAVKVSGWVYDWMSGKMPTKIVKEIPYHLKRHLQNQHKIPATHFSILQEMSLTLLGPMESQGYTLPERFIPDISQGRMFSDFLRKNGFGEPSRFQTYKHEYPDGRVVDARLYPIELLPEFRKFVANTWMPERAEKYFAERDQDALPYLHKVLALTYKKAA